MIADEPRCIIYSDRFMHGFPLYHYSGKNRSAFPVYIYSNYMNVNMCVKCSMICVA